MLHFYHYKIINDRYIFILSRNFGVCITHYFDYMFLLYRIDSQMNTYCQISLSPFYYLILNSIIILIFITLI
jgi:hypothetical protein